MTNVQLYFAIGLPILLAVFGLFNSISRMARLEAMVDGTNKRLDQFLEQTG